MTRVIVFVCAAAAFACERSPGAPSANSGAADPGSVGDGRGPTTAPTNRVPPLAALPPLPAANYFWHEAVLDDARHPVVRIIHPSSRQPPPHATLARWSGMAWEELPRSILAWPMPVSGPQGQLYAYDSKFIDRSFQVWNSGGWLATPEVPGPPEFSVRAATADRSSGELIAAISDGARLSIARFHGDAWTALGTMLDVDTQLGPFQGLVSICADHGSVHVAYVNRTGVIVATPGPDGWTSSSVPGSGLAEQLSPDLRVGPQGRLLVSWKGPVGQVAVLDGGGWRVLPNTVGDFHLFFHAAIRDEDGAPIALFQRGFPDRGPMDVAAATWKNGAWDLSPVSTTATWGYSGLSANGDGVASAEQGGSISFTLLHAPD